VLKLWVVIVDEEKKELGEHASDIEFFKKLVAALNTPILFIIDIFSDNQFCSIFLLSDLSERKILFRK
jgi:hypothetical protein